MCLHGTFRVDADESSPAGSYHSWYERLRKHNVLQDAGSELALVCRMRSGDNRPRRSAKSGSTEADGRCTHMPPSLVQEQISSPPLFAAPLPTRAGQLLR